MIRWFLSKTVREVASAHKHYRRLLAAQRDVLSPQAIGAVQAALDNLKTALTAGENIGALRLKAEELQFAAEKWLKPYPHAAYRENVEVLLVALAVAMGIRTFFLQPFKIPTGSMQPTLYGVTSQNLLAEPGFKIPTGWERVKEWFAGVSYVHVVAPADGRIEALTPMRRFLIFNIKQSITIGGVEQSIWLPPDMGEAQKDRNGNTVDPLVYRAQLDPLHSYHKGEDVVYLRMCAGDHLFVDRLTYNFRKPERGDIVVFATAGIPKDHREDYPSGRWNVPSDQFFIKRLVGLGGETLQIGEDRHLIVNGKRLDAGTPHFDGVYSFDPKSPPEGSKFSGHVSQPQMPFFRDNAATYTIPKGNVMVMGDNTMNSLDSRYWGDFPESSIIGKSWFVYWPLTDRFGWGTH
jgi:signal peptidase I